MSDDAIDRLIGECRYQVAIEPARVDAACSQLASYRRHMAELEAERAKLRRMLDASRAVRMDDVERFVELAKALGVDPAMLEDGPACLHDAIVALRSERDELRARLARAVELLRQVDALPSLRVTSHPIVLDVRDFLSEEQAREEGR